MLPASTERPRPGGFTRSELGGAVGLQGLRVERDGEGAGAQTGCGSAALSKAG